MPKRGPEAGEGAGGNAIEFTLHRFHARLARLAPLVFGCFALFGCGDWTGFGTALEAAKELASAIACNAPLSVRNSKAVAGLSRLWSDVEAFELQKSYTDEVFASEDAAEGPVAFAERRAPVWKGR